MKISRSVVISLLGFALAGLTMFISTFFWFSESSNPALNDGGFQAKRIIGLLIFVGSMLTVAAGGNWKQRSTSWNLAVLGLPVAVSGWGLYTATIFLTDPLASFPLSLGVGLTGAHIYKLFEVWAEEAKTRKNVEDYKNDT